MAFTEMIPLFGQVIGVVLTELIWSCARETSEKHSVSKLMMAYLKHKKYIFFKAISVWMTCIF